MEELREFRRQNGLTQDALGEYLGVKKSFISKIENGLEKLPFDKFRKLLDNEMGWNISPLEEMMANTAEESSKSARITRKDLFGLPRKKTELYRFQSGPVQILLPRTSREIKIEALREQNEELKKVIVELRERLDKTEKERQEFWEMIKQLSSK